MELLIPAALHTYFDVEKAIYPRNIQLETFIRWMVTAAITLCVRVRGQSKKLLNTLILMPFLHIPSIHVELI